MIITQIRPSPFLYEFFGGAVVWLILLSLILFPIIFLAYFGFKKGILLCGCALIGLSIVDYLLWEYFLDQCADSCGMINSGVGFIGGILILIGCATYFFSKK